MKVDLGEVVVRASVVCQPMDGGAVLMDPETGGCFELNLVGAEVWTRLRAGESPTRMIDSLAGRYDVTAEALEVDIRNLIDELLRHRLVSRRSS